MRLEPTRLRPGPRPPRTRPAVFLDRDGVLVDAGVDDQGRARSPRALDDVVITHEADQALHELRAAGYLLIVVTNQPDVARGFVHASEVIAVDEMLLAQLPIDDVYICMHDRPDGCSCRKPRPGMLEVGANDWNVNLARSWIIGDRWVDVAAGAAAGVSAILLDGPNAWLPTSEGPPPPELVPTHSEPTLRGCVAWILGAKPTAVGSPGREDE